MRVERAGVRIDDYDNSQTENTFANHFHFAAIRYEPRRKDTEIHSVEM